MIALVIEVEIHGLLASGVLQRKARRRQRRNALLQKSSLTKCFDREDVVVIKNDCTVISCL